MDLSKLPDSQRQELEQLQKQFQEHQQQQQQQPPAYDPFQVHHQSYDPSQAYNQSYYHNYQQQSHHQQYDASYYQNYYSNSYQQQQYTETTGPNEQHRNEESGSGSVGLGQGSLGGTQQPNVGYPGVPGINASAAAAAVAALSQLTQFAGAMGGPMAGGGHHDQGLFRPPLFRFLLESKL